MMKAFFCEFMHRTMFGFCISLWCFLCSFIHHLSGFIKHIPRFKADDDPHENDPNCGVVFSQLLLSKSSKGSDSGEFNEREGLNSYSNLDSSSNSNSEFFFGFQFQNQKDSIKSVSETESSDFLESSSISCSSSSKYQFVSAKGFSAVIQESQSMSFTVQEMFVGSKDSSNGDDLQKIIQEADAVDQEKTEGFVENRRTEENEDNYLDEKKLSDGFQIILENQSVPIQSSPEPSGSSNGFSSGIDSGNNEELESDTITAGIDCRDNLGDTDDEYIELDPNLQNSREVDKESASCKDTDVKCEPMENKLWVSDSDEEDEEDVLMEHRDLIKQMKMELKNAKQGGLPTILEESESSKVMDDLKPLKIDEKFEHRDRMEEIQKFYKNYVEKMRKLDILNYQTMHAISILQMKDPIRLSSSHKSSVSAIKSLILQNLWPGKQRRIYADPTLKSITELHRDLELVYVGQICLSWEIILWQYGKAKELLEYDSEGRYSYNQVAGEFQHLQVLIQRFIEDEPFEGPRVQNYVKKRSLLRDFLQVPALRDDSLKDKKGRIEHEEDAISVELIAEIIEESMRIIWEFIRADKHYADLSLKDHQGTRVGLQDDPDSELLMNIKTDLQKKEKRIKDILRSGNCIVKKFQKIQGGWLDRALFISQVELRLVSRVVGLPRVRRDQLLWCEKKLNNINIVNRKVHLEPLFLLFAC